MLELLETPINLYCILVVIVGAFALGMTYCFGRFLAKYNLFDLSLGSKVIDDTLQYLSKVNFRANLPRHFIDANADYLEKRNNFWSIYLQVVVAVFVLIVLAILLITKTINAEAGMPLLSATTGFAIAKTIGSTQSNRQGNDIDKRDTANS